MNRDRISGFEFTVFGYTVEVVTLDGFPCVLAIWHNTRFVWRVGKV